MILEFNGIKPVIDKTCYISQSVDIIGDVVIEKNANIWFGTTIRGDMSKIYIGENTNIQENSVIHVDFDYETYIGKNVTIGHRAIIHGCEISDNVLIGMGSIIGKNSIVGAGSLVTQNKVFEEGVLIMGSPAKVVRKLTEDEIKSIEKSSKNYVEISKKYL